MTLSQSTQHKEYTISFISFKQNCIWLHIARDACQTQKQRPRELQKHKHEENNQLLWALLGIPEGAGMPDLGAAAGAGTPDVGIPDVDVGSPDGRPILEPGAFRPEGLGKLIGSGCLSLSLIHI